MNTGQLRLRSTHCHLQHQTGSAAMGNDWLYPFKERSQPQINGIFLQSHCAVGPLVFFRILGTNKTMMDSLTSFHRRCARFITGQHIGVDINGCWTYPFSSVTLSQVGLFPIGEGKTLLCSMQRRALFMVYAQDLRP